MLNQLGALAFKRTRHIFASGRLFGHLQLVFIKPPKGDITMSEKKYGHTIDNLLKITNLRYWWHCQERKGKLGDLQLSKYIVWEPCMSVQVCVAVDRYF